MTKEDLTNWALKNGFKLTAGALTLAKPNRPADIIVRIVLKATVANLEIKKPSGKWEKMKGAVYGDIMPDEETDVPRGLGLVSIPGLAKLMQDNRDAMVFSR
jgi:hypothetical protein